MALRDSQALTNGISAALRNLVRTEQPESLKLSDTNIPKRFQISRGFAVACLLRIQEFPSHICMWCTRLKSLSFL